jgi:phage-related tail protein
MGIEYYLFAAFVFGLGAALAFIIVKSIRKNRAEEAGERERQEKKLTRMYDELSGLLGALESYVEDSKAEIDRAVRRAHEDVLSAAVLPRTQHKTEEKESEDADSGRDDLYERAAALSIKGLSAGEIAEQCKVSRGEVNLVLALGGRGLS